MKTKLVDYVELFNSKFIRVNKLEWYMFDINNSNYNRVTGNEATFIENQYQKETKADFENDKYA